VIATVAMLGAAVQRCSGAAVHGTTALHTNTLLLNVLACATIAHVEPKSRGNLEIAHGLHAREIDNSLKLKAFHRN
jgi:hypothetical protein